MTGGARRSTLIRFAAYALLTLIPVTGLGVVLARTFANETDRAALNEGVLHAKAIAEAGVVSQLDGRDLRAGVNIAERGSLARTTSPLLAHGSVERLRIRANNGAVVFDAAHPYAPASLAPEPDDEITAASHGRVVSLRTTLNSDGVDGERHDGAASIEVYLPLRDDQQGKPFGVLEVYIPYGPIAAVRNASLHRMYTTLLDGLVAAWLVLAVIVWSVTGRLRRESEHNEHLALHDMLTGLPNRTLFRDRLTVAIRRARRDGSDVTVAVVDLDRFKEVNDTLGHHNGDLLLRHIASRVQSALRPGDTLARLGGDEFGIVLTDIDRVTAPAILARVQTAVSNDIELNGMTISAEATIGAAVWSADDDDPATLLQNAELAMYAAKRARAGMLLYSDDFERFDPSRLALVSELRRAITGDELELHYQPKLDVASGRVLALEALVRWNHPTRGLLPPGAFLSVAESTGLIGPLTHWVIEQALAQIAAWGDELAELHVAVNISARDLRDERFADWVLAQLDRFGVPARRLVLEVTETSFISDMSRATQLLQRFDDAGVRISIDDFGQGYTSLSLLSHLPVSELKIDRSFVAAMQSSSEDRAIVASVIELGHQLGLTVVAEGVETEAVLDQLRALGCDVVQGYLFSPPMPSVHAAAWVAAHRAVTPAEPLATAFRPETNRRIDSPSPVR